MGALILWTFDIYLKKYMGTLILWTYDIYLNMGALLSYDGDMLYVNII